MATFLDRNGSRVSESRVRAILNKPRSSGVTRKDFTDRLGLPETATNEEVLAAVDAVVARQRAADDKALYESIYGRRA